MNNQISSIPQFVSVSDLQRDYPSLLKQLKKSQKPLLVLKKNVLEAVMLSPEAYKILQEKITEYEEKDALEAIRIYEEEKKAGKLKVAKRASDFFKDED
ncbi:hypothetical protein COT03_01075 [Candidatus Shapirobacteria bacterium CG07_land_8_20_14_0_80_39_18]|uniref:Antitoxin n=1 Tax=Candidatus Shapirobacteria bacterium CG07_land_8_20_14_0_80_39_18 TaxID=1974882 RepID=A0A2M6YRQ5_9BACT|nr:MAG: hypothetical protein COT03_01075 [Candidatus Shapirobacteria bacterium CG07_land_8_20_14_0_80_39_18]